ncbi:hypothetical protein GGH92_005686 [Coemansia sp. RSA 2673]|nr:hypothetical protein GGH13_009122 [Coemansia sp. S155-1]KAJ2341722.1 hypothetical protein GGH92_005686 [Coemansia sp. RSA 2673]
MAIWTQGGFFQELAEREQHLQWFPKAFVPAVKKDDGFVVTVTGCTCGTCEPCKEPPKPAPAPPPPPPKCEPHHCHCCHTCC